MTASQASDSRAFQGNGRVSKPIAQERYRHILSVLEVDGVVHVSDVAMRLGVSDMTIRRDLIELEREGLLNRTHGGAVPVARVVATPPDAEEPSFEARLDRDRAAKAAIAALAARLVAGARAIAIDVGTTTFMMARALDLPRHTKVFTNSVRLAGHLLSKADEVYLAGGRVRAEEQAVVGPSAIAQFERLWFDVAVIGVAGLTPEGMFDYSFEEVDMKRVYLRRAQRTIVLCDSSKFQQVSLVQIGRLDEITTLVTEAEPPPPVRAALDAARVEVLIAPMIGGVLSQPSEPSESGL